MNSTSHIIESRYVIEALFVVFGFVMFLVTIPVEHSQVHEFCVTGTQIHQTDRLEKHTNPGTASVWTMDKAGN